MKGYISVFTLVLLGMQAVQAQNPTDTLFTFGPHAVSVEEFERGFLKNKDLSNQKPDAAEIDDYLRLYQRFKLKVQDAYDLKMDTVPQFMQELNGYRRQLAKPYLSDREVTDQLMKEGYERMKWEVSTAHILILSRQDDLPEDTLKAWNKIQAIAAELAKNPEKFSDIAFEKSEDPSAKDNRGTLGFFTAFQFVYPYETVAFNTPAGQISKVFRTSYGYHILKVLDRRPNAGEMKVAHLMLRLSPNANGDELQQKKAKADEIYSEIRKGVPFEDMVARWSEDYSSKSMNGELDYFYATAHLNGELTAEFTEAAFSLKKDGEVCAPFRTPYGYHILKRLDLKPLPSYEEMKPVLKQNISSDSRSYKSTQAMIAKIKQEYSFKEVPGNLKTFTATLDSSLLKAMWMKGSGPAYQLPLFQLGDETFTADRFAGYLVAMQRPSKLKQVSNVVNTYYNNWVDASCIDYLDRNLNKKYPEFAALYQEYREGILLFNLAQDKVWNKAIRDTAGLESFFKANASSYSWNDRFQVTIYNARTESIMKSVAKMLKKRMSDDSIYRFHTKESLLNLSIQEGKFEWKDSNAFVNELFAAGTKYRSKKNQTLVMGQRGNDQWIVMRIHQFLPAGAKALDETRGPVISDYQVVLEDAWVNDVAQRYPLKVNEQAYRQLKERLTR